MGTLLFIGPGGVATTPTRAIRRGILAVGGMDRDCGERSATIRGMSLLRRPPGLLVLCAVVLAGLGSGVYLFRTQAFEVRAGILKRLKAAPSDPDEQLTAWLDFGEPMIQHRLTQLSFGRGAHWLVTHTADGPGGREIWGIPMEGPRPARFERVGLTVRIHLPAPALMDHGVLQGDNANRIPHHPKGLASEDAAARAVELMEWFLERILAALEEDIAGTRAEIVIGELPQGG